ncbi:MAG: PEP-CTERM sorting domain-containing protein [Phycisphaerales bacterium]|nr:PEP-CTERM sorting domain-containing protein [Phycisphaerales bacterium]
MKRFLLMAATLVAAPAMASIGVDGTAEGAYGAAVSVQTLQTNFGDANMGAVDYANGSELDAAYAVIKGGNLYLTLAGNLESNFNKLEIFIDSHAGGQNQLRGDNPNVDFNGLNRMAGLTFDAAFSPDHWLSVTGGGGPYQMYANYSELLSGGGGNGYYLGQTGAASGGVLGGGFNPNGILATINNSNAGGVTGGTGPSSGAGVTTGVEFCIPLAALGDPTGPICISAFVNGGGHDFVSNQVLGSLPNGTGNLGEPSTVNFNNHEGDQFFCVVPEPASLVLAAVGLLALRRR